MNDPNLTAAECDALIHLILKTPCRLTDKYSDDFQVNFRTIRKKINIDRILIKFIFYG